MGWWQDMNAIEQRLREREDRRLSVIRPLLEENKIIRVVAEFSGYNDEGSVESVKIQREGASGLERPEDHLFDPLLYEIVYDCICSREPGWEIEEGSSGFISLDRVPETNKIVVRVTIERH